jgi:dTDP-4-amino-4,6-dideoxygalactose transaminase
VTPAGRTHVFHQYTVVVDERRDEIVRSLREAGVGADIYYPIPVHRQAYVQERGIHADLPVTDRLAATTLSLPIFPGLTEEDQAVVISAVRDAIARHGPVSGQPVAAGASSESLRR